MGGWGVDRRTERQTEIDRDGLTERQTGIAVGMGGERGRTVEESGTQTGAARGSLVCLSSQHKRQRALIPPLPPLLQRHQDRARHQAAAAAEVSVSGRLIPAWSSCSPLWATAAPTTTGDERSRDEATRAGSIGGGTGSEQGKGRPLFLDCRAPVPCCGGGISVSVSPAPSLLSSFYPPRRRELFGSHCACRRCFLDSYAPLPSSLILILSSLPRQQRRRGLWALSDPCCRSFCAASIIRGVHLTRKEPTAASTAAATVRRMLPRLMGAR